ncbi:MAG TPA: TetR family transcriptional regulator [Chloroflexi bacterium]|nr:TetR family transcriptional regulator [Chloroflexota bacterium]HBY09626.1 TetR family transcriptional regulator [Chloroflexota bacterium]
MIPTNDAVKVTKKRVRRNRTEEILKAATNLFGEYGFQGTTLSMIAEEVGLTEPGVLHYFPSKVHLLQVVLDSRDQKDLEKYAKLINVDKKDVAEIFKLLEDVVVQNEKIPGLIQMFTVLVSESLRTDHPSHNYFVDRYRGAREIYVNQFLKLHKAQTRSDVNLDELASLIMAVMDGLQIQWLLDPEKVNMVATFELFSKIVVGYLQK